MSTNKQSAKKPLSFQGSGARIGWPENGATLEGGGGGGYICRSGFFILLIPAVGDFMFCFLYFILHFPFLINLPYSFSSILLLETRLQDAQVSEKRHWACEVLESQQSKGVECYLDPSQPSCCPGDARSPLKL